MIESIKLTLSVAIISMAMLFFAPGDGHGQDTGGVIAGGGRTVWLSTLDLTVASQGWGKPQADKSVQEKSLSIGGKRFEKGFGTHAPSNLYVLLDGAGLRFTAYVGVDDEVDGNTAASVIFQVVGDGKLLWESGVMKADQPARHVDVDLKGVKLMTLQVGDAGDNHSYDHADWADARLEVVGKDPRTAEAPIEEPFILTPQPPRAPRINGPKIYGVRPGSPFMFTIPATGDRPMQFAADGLPRGLVLDPKAGRITGSVKERGEYVTTLQATNALGRAERMFRIVVGDKLALTPSMGWNSWYCYFDKVTDQQMRDAADAMVNSGMIQHGYEYVNIDDGWMVRPDSSDPMLGGEPRDSRGMINANKKFPDMKAMTDYIHGKGLKVGLYTSPGPLTCAGYAGSYQHEELDARRFAEWGFDFLKYDWCSYGRVAGDNPPLAELKKPYELMSAALRKLDRDFIFNLCQYGMGDVWKWGQEVGGHSWRTAGDLGWAPQGLWGNINRIGFSQNGLENHAGPGHWNDPDYLLIGHIGWKGKIRPTPLTPNEQYLHVSLWSLLAAPLIFSGDMARLDEFTLSLLTNDEVLEVDLDPLGRQAKRVARDGDGEVWAKDMEDGSKAVGLFNRGELPRTVAANWSDLGIKGPRVVRDLWRQKDMGTFDDKYESSVARHGAVLVRIVRKTGE